jgi:hypothetical protein
MPKESKQSSRITRAAENQARAIDYRKMGHTFAVIGKNLGVTEARAHQYVKAGLEQLAKQAIDNADGLRELELARIDQMTAVLGPKVFPTKKNPDLEPDLNAINTLIRLSERRCRLLGIDAPARSVSEITGKDGAPLAVSHGVLMVPAPVSPEEWEKAAKEAQEKHEHGN